VTKGPKNLQSTGKWRAIEEEFLATGDAAQVEKALTLARDESVVEAHRAVLERAFPQGVATLAGGAYGRGHTFPYSELDIVLLLDSDKQSDELKETLPEFVRLLWNAGLRLNSAVLTIGECLEAVERASVPAFSLLDRRLLAGDRGCRPRWRSIARKCASASVKPRPRATRRMATRLTMPNPT
jgi:[protein-PII] uridylyltransferase